MLNSMLWTARLVPRFVSGWGLLAATLLLTGSVLDLFDVFAGMSQTGLEITLAGPIALQEMVLAVWLITKGLDVTALRRGSPNPPSESIG
jgi:hypothetical protein